MATLYSSVETLCIALDEAGPESTVFRSLARLPIRLLHLTEYDWAGRANSVQLYTVIKKIPTFGWTGGTLSVRVHTKDRWTNTATLRVILQNVAPTPDDPSRAFAGSNVATASIPAADSSPAVYTAELTSAPLGAWMRLILRWEQGANASAAGTTQGVNISVDLAGRPVWDGEPAEEDAWTTDE